MTLHEMTAVASGRLWHWWELHGLAGDVALAITGIAGEMAPRRPQVRREVELHLHDEWARLCAQEGAEGE
jgi:hypothetical protein